MLLVLEEKPMRVAIIGVSHWHAPLYYRPAARLPGVEIVAVSDLTPAVAEATAREFDARAFTDYRDLVTDVRPDFVFAFGRHCDMPEIASTLIEHGVPFVIEKPCGLNAAHVAAIRDEARAKGLHAGTGFNYRVSDLYKRIQAVVDDNEVTHASFRWISGIPNRYRELGCPWMLDPKLSGGGPTINLAGHFVDMFQQLTRSKVTEVTALMGHYTWKLPIEDYSSMVVRSPRSICTIETGYSFPGQLGSFDLRFSIRTTRHYIIARDDDILEIANALGIDGGTSDGLKVAAAVGRLAVWIEVAGVETRHRPEGKGVAIRLGEGHLGHAHLRPGACLVHHLDRSSHLLLELSSQQTGEDVRAAAGGERDDQCDRFTLCRKVHLRRGDDGGLRRGRLGRLRRCLGGLGSLGGRDRGRCRRRSGCRLAASGDQETGRCYQGEYGDKWASHALLLLAHGHFRRLLDTASRSAKGWR